MTTDRGKMTTLEAAQMLGGAVILVLMEGEGFQTMRLILSQAIINKFFDGNITTLDKARIHELSTIHGAEAINEACTILLNRYDFDSVLEDLDDDA